MTKTCGPHPNFNILFITTVETFIPDQNHQLMIHLDKNHSNYYSLQQDHCHLECDALNLPRLELHSNLNSITSTKVRITFQSC